MPWINLTSIFVSFFATSLAYSIVASTGLGPFAVAHPQSKFMALERPQLYKDRSFQRSDLYFDAPIPRVIHQIWFGDPSIFDSERASGWQQIAEIYGYEYHLWTEDDDAFCESEFGANILLYMQQLRRDRRFDAASDVLRYHLLEKIGGMYFDNDVPAPRSAGRYLDPEDLWPLNGLVFSGENHAREVNNSAFFLQNHVMMSAPGHPVMTALIKSLLPNRDYQNQFVNAWDTGADFLTGQSLMSATVTGTFTLLPDSYLNFLGMFCWPDVSVYRKELRDKFLRLPDRKLHVDSIHPNYWQKNRR